MPQVPGRPERLRPKHQNLVLKCYPRLPKNAAADVKPNNSELSYLLYYASTRQHKLPKVGSYLESKTTYDVGHSQSARVQITLQILTAVLEHHTISRASGFALIAPSVSCAFFLCSCLSIFPSSLAPSQTTTSDGDDNQRDHFR